MRIAVVVLALAAVYADEQTLTEEQVEFLAENLQQFENRTFALIGGKGEQIEEINANSHLNQTLFQGDIVLTASQAEDLIGDELANTTRRSKRGAALSDQRLLWDKTQAIPYFFDPSVTSSTRQQITRALRYWEENTCLRFALNGQGPNRIRFIKDDGCYSNLGRVFNKPEQKVSIGDGCELIGTTTHEIAHALGIHHTHVRHDRDTYVTVNSANVQRKMYQNNFVKETTTSNDNYGLAYEYGSVMHYDGYAFPINDRSPTIVARDVDYQDTMGNRRPPTFLDVLMMNTHYSCFDKCASTQTTCANGGVPDVKNCAHCKCPSGFAGPQCTQRAGLCGKSVKATNEWQTLEGQVGNKMKVMDLLGSECVWWIENPTNSRVLIQIMQLSGICSRGCDVGGVEFKVHENKQATGYTFCCSQSNGKMLTAVGKTIPVLAYNNYAYTAFQIRFKLL